MMVNQEQETLELLEKLAQNSYFLVVMENQTGEVIYTRELKGDDLLDCDSYLPEIEQRLDSESIAVGLGQYRISIIIGSENSYTWESKDYFLGD